MKTRFFIKFSDVSTIVVAHSKNFLNYNFTNLLFRYLARNRSNKHCRQILNRSTYIRRKNVSPNGTNMVHVMQKQYFSLLSAFISLLANFHYSNHQFFSSPYAFSFSGISISMTVARDNGTPALYNTRNKKTRGLESSWKIRRIHIMSDRNFQVTESRLREGWAGKET